jgi:CPA2 family monovalent cation:H+ antiporter-2
MVAEIELLRDVVIIFGLSVAVLSVFHRIKAPAIVGFLLTGILAGPQGLGLIQAQDQVSLMAEIGVILLLFTIGIEISLKDLLQIKRYVLIGGSLQVLLTVAAVFLILIYLGVPVGEAVLLGFLLSLSSTAIVLRIIQKKAEFDSLHGRTILGILIFQDIAVVPMMLAIPLLPGAAQTAPESPLIILAKGAAIILLVILSAKWIVPRILFQIAATGDRELFLLCIVAICFAVAWITSAAGLSLGLGAFLAGLIISESPYSHQAFGNMVPLRDAFTSFFFVSIGMLMDIDFFLQNPGFIVLIALLVMILKSVITGSVITLMGLPLRIAVLVGLALSQIGEFSFILSKVGFESGLLTGDIYQLFLDVTVLTMGATSFIMSISPRIADGMHRLPIPERLKNRKYPSGRVETLSLMDHLLIIGFGVNGRNVARSAQVQGIPYAVVEMDPEIVMNEGKKGEPIFYGDSAQEAVLQHVRVGEAKVMVIAISDAASTRRITELARRLNPDLYIIARTRYLQEMKPLIDLGANEVIPEEYETSVEIFSRVLQIYQVPSEDIESFTAELRADGYEMFRSFSREPYCAANVDLLTEEVSTLRVCEGSEVAGKRLEEMRLEDYEVSLLAVHRGLETIPNPDEKLRLQVDDVAVLMGPREKVSQISKQFGNSENTFSDASIESAAKH